MKNIIVALFVLYCSLGYSQTVERSIKISKEVGRTIDSTECRIYKLDFCSDDFISAQVISISGSTMILRITKMDTVTETYFSPKDLTDLKIKVGDKKYTQEHLESMRSGGSASVDNGTCMDSLGKAILIGSAALVAYIIVVCGIDDNHCVPSG